MVAHFGVPCTTLLPDREDAICRDGARLRSFRDPKHVTTYELEY
jgi:hypothetical protein